MQPRPGPGSGSRAAPGIHTPAESLGPQGSLREELSRWLGKALSDWPALIRGGGYVDTVLDPSTGTETLSVWRLVSTLDIDISGEGGPDIFRWQENSRFAAATYAVLTERECLAILAENQVDLPRDARLQGMTRFEMDEGSECVALRYAHLLPDRDFRPGDGENLPMRNPGFIVVENDFREFHIDASRRLLIGESRKWRECAGE